MKRKQKNMIIARIVLSAMMVLFVGVQYVCASESALMSEYAYLYSNETEKSTNEIEKGLYNHVTMSGSVGSTSAYDVEYVMRGRNLTETNNWHEVMRLSIAAGHSFVPQKDNTNYMVFKGTMYGKKESDQQTGCIASCALSRTNN